MANYSFGFTQPFGFNGAYGYAGSLGLAQIMYQTNLGNFIYNTDSSGNAILDNYGSLGDTYDGLLNTGRALELGATNDLTIPIHHTLGSEEAINGTFDTDTDWVKGTGWTISGGTANCDGTQTASSYLSQVTLTAGETYLITYDVTSYTAGNIKATVSGAEGTNHASIGTYVEILTTTSTSFAMKADINFIGSIDNVSVKQITNPNSFLTYYDFTDGLVTLGNSVDGGSSDSADIYSGTLTAVATSIVLSGITDGYSLVCDGLSGTGAIRVNATITFNGEYSSFIFYASNIIGTPKILSYYDGANTVTLNHTITSGKNELIIKGRVTTTFLNLIFVTNVTYSFDMTAIQSLMLMPISTTYTFNNKTVNNILTHSTAWSASDFGKINSNPQLLAKLALSGTGSIDELDMALTASDAWCPCSENEGAYVVDARAGYGAEVGKTQTYRMLNADETTVVTPIANGEIDLEVTVVGTNTSRPTFSQRVTDNFDTAKLYYIDLSWECISGTAAFTGMYVGSGTGAYPMSVTLTAGQAHREVGIFRPTGTDNFTGTVFDGTNLFKVKTYVHSVREATAEEITNYASTIRTNVDLNPKGLQTTSLVLDGAGVPTSYSDKLLQFNGDGRYVDTGFMPPSDSAWEIDFVINCDTDGTSRYHGIDSSTSANDLRFGVSSTNRITVYIGTTAVGSALAQSIGLHHARIEFDGAGNGNLVIDNTNTIPFSSPDYAYSALESLFIGDASRLKLPLGTNPPNTELGTFQYVNRARTATERTKAYNDAKAIYPTLP